MKTSLSFLLLLLALVSCEQSVDVPVISHFNSSDCKGNKKSSMDMESLRFKMISANALLVEHQNVFFNCEPGNITAEAEIIENNINIYENEETHLANCLCLHDLSFKINGVKTGENKITVFLMGLRRFEDEINLTIGTDTIVYISDI